MQRHCGIHDNAQCTHDHKMGNEAWNADVLGCIIPTLVVHQQSLRWNDEDETKDVHNLKHYRYSRNGIKPQRSTKTVFNTIPQAKYLRRSQRNPHQCKTKQNIKQDSFLKVTVISCMYRHVIAMSMRSYVKVNPTTSLDQSFNNINLLWVDSADGKSVLTT